MKIIQFCILSLFLLSFHSSFAQKGIHSETLALTGNNNSNVRIDFGNSAASIFTSGIAIEGQPLTSSQKGGIFGIVANTYSDYSSQKGSALGRMAESKSFSGDARFVGVRGLASSQALRNVNSLYSTLVGGQFEVQPTTNVTLSGNNFWVAGVHASLKGTINYNRTSSSNGAIAALIAIDENQGTAQSWAGYFQGQSYLSDKTIIGRTEIPTMASTFDVSNFNLFVKGGILTEECLILTEDQWADYVFEKDYNLQPLTEVAQFIEKNGHLPNIPAGETLDKNGIPLAKMTILQQEKIEELFLHSIQMNKENQTLKAENEALKQRLDKIEQRLFALEK